MDRYGVEEVEDFIDACTSVEDLIDIHSPFIRRRETPDRYAFAQERQDEEAPAASRFQAKEYMDRFINPPEVLSAETERIRQERSRQEKAALALAAALPTRDVMLFLLEHAPLKAWQADVLSILRDEAYYFAPQGQTKIMNEGWASYWHSTIMTRQGLEPQDVINYCDHHSGTLATSAGRLNPYKLGIELFRDIEERWNKGRFGKDYDECEDAARRRTWNTAAGVGREKIFEVRRIHNDVTFIDEFLTLEFCQENKLFSFGYNTSREQYEIESREFPKIKQRLLFSLTNLGRPIISVRDGNYKNRGELFLEHHYNGVELKTSYARDTLANLHRLWTRPIHIETHLDETKTILSYDGSEHTSKKVA
jgi:stage V sporulation protein R